MKKLILLAFLGLTGLTTFAQNARVQVIHNSPDDAAAAVDVYLNGAILLNDFAYRFASPFIDAPAGVEISIDIAPGTSTSSAESIFNLTTTLADGESYIIVANGITGLSSTTYTPAPAFSLDVFDMAQESAAVATNTDVLVHHGSTDAPVVDITAAGGGTLVEDAAYPQFAGYLELPTDDYVLEVRDMTGTTVVAAFEANLTGLDGAAAAVLASGFLDPSVNGNGPAFGLFLALPTGGALIALPAVALPPANDDPCSAQVVPSDGTITFGTNVNASVSTGEDLITPPQDGCGVQTGWCGNESGIDNSIWYAFTATSTFVTISTCEEGNAIDTQVALYEIDPLGDCSDYSTYTLLGANDDAPAADCLAGAQFSSTVNYLGLTVGETYYILLDSYNGEQGATAISVLNAPAPTSRLQVIHNSADDVAAVVDVYVNGALFIDDFAFRTATAFVDVPALAELSIDIAPGTSADVSESIYNTVATLDVGVSYIAVAQGITGLSSGTYTPLQDFELLVIAGAQEVSNVAGNTDIAVVHGSTDAPVVDIAEVTEGVLVNDIAFGGLFGYLQLLTADYVLEVQTADNSATVASYSAPLETLGLQDLAITVLASGFLDPSVNNDGEPFGLWVALPAGGPLVALPLSVGIDEYSAVAFSMYPNPADDVLSINSSEVIDRIDIYDTQGRIVLSESNAVQQIDISALPQGAYQVAVVVGNRISAKPMMKF